MSASTRRLVRWGMAPTKKGRSLLGCMWHLQERRCPITKPTRLLRKLGLMPPDVAGAKGKFSPSLLSLCSPPPAVSPLPPLPLLVLPFPSALLFYTLSLVLPPSVKGILKRKGSMIKPLMYSPTSTNYSYIQRRDTEILPNMKPHASREIYNPKFSPKKMNLYAECVFPRC